MITDPNRIQLWRLGILGLLVLMVTGVLLSRLWKVQIVDSVQALHDFDISSTIRNRIAPVRGAICDRNGVLLAENRPSFDLDFYLDELRRDYAQSHHGHVPRIALANDAAGHKRWGDIDIVQIVKESIAPIQDSLGMTAPLNEKEIVDHFRTDPDLPYHYMRDLDPAMVANFEERNLGVTGIRISQSPAREYPYGALAAHILGYTGRPIAQNEHVHVADDGTTYEYESVGRVGIESMMDDQLQGEPGSRFQRVSSRGYTIPDPRLDELFTPPTMGNTIYLTIDSRIQYIAETAMQKSGWTRGAIVVMNPNNGDVLALASFPNYDPNKFIPGISAKDYDALNNDPTTPLYNRALHSYQPGSTYKIMVALAGLKSGNTTPDTSFDCPGSIQIGDHLFHNSDSTDAGNMSLIHAICVSSDVYFYQYGIRAGIEAIDDMGKRAGFGHKWGLLGPDEDPGILPGPEWMKDPKVNEWLKKTQNVDRWSDAQTANTSIGQGYVQTTPLQMATFLCAVANGGTVYKPRLYSRVVSADGHEEPAPVEGQVYDTLDVKPSDLAAVQEGMHEVIEEGTGTEAQVPGYEAAGKTGTAQHTIRLNGQKLRDLKCWFYSYIPFKNPRYVVCVVVEGGVWGGTSTAPISQNIMQRLMAMDDKGAVETPVFMNPIQGNFNGATVDDTHPWDTPKPGTPGAPGAPGSADDNTDAPSTTPMADAPPGGNPNPNSKHGHH